MPIGPREIILLVALIVFFFGARRIPDLARGLGTGIRNFKGQLRAENRSGDDPPPPDRP